MLLSHRSVRAYRCQVGVSILSLETLAQFVLSASRDPAVGLVVEDLTISIPPDLEYSLEAIQRCLQLVPNVESLVLELPLPPPLTIMRGLMLCKIELFSTNLPHACLSSFLAGHPSLHSVVLRHCGDESRCPLGRLRLPHITELQCPSRCLPGIAHDRVARATVNLTRLASNAALVVHSLSASPLYSLSVDFFSNDYDTLSRIAAAAPRLQKLKLVEKPGVQVSHSRRIAGVSLTGIQRQPQQNRRPWNDVASWHQTLLQLSYLEEFVLKTLVRISPRRSETEIITRWAYGRPQRQTPHPTLYHIAVLQPGRGHDSHELKEWFRGSSGESWELIVDAVGHDVQL